jgi:superfamily II DNA or RNA helicase
MSTHIDKFSGSGTHFRDYQLDCYNKLHNAHDEGMKKCLCLMFCGTGKTRVFYTFILDFNFSIVVFPTLALVDQFIADYATNSSMNCLQFDFSFLRVSSGNDIPHGRKATTKPKEIKIFLKEDVKKLVAVTYASLGLLFDCMKELGSKADTIIYDEAHHAIGDQAQTIVFDKKSPVKFSAFFTATYRNANGITMFKVPSEDDEDYDSPSASDSSSSASASDSDSTPKSKTKSYVKSVIIDESSSEDDSVYNAETEDTSEDTEEDEDEDEEEGRVKRKEADCGPCIFRYTLQQAIDREEPVCQDFEFCVFLSRRKEFDYIIEDDDEDKVESNDKITNNLRKIAEVIVSNDCKRVIINHALSEAENETRTSVDSFATEANKKFLKDKIKLLYKEKKYKIIYNGVGANTKNRTKIINDFNKEPKAEDNEIQVISQCKLFSEGIDTKHADMTVFMDKRGATHTIIQIIGRVTRKKIGTDKKGIILLPVVVDGDAFNAAVTDEEKDKVMRDCINQEENFNPILNVMTALREDDPVYYDMCLRYPSKFSPEEIEKKINESGRKLEQSKGTLKENVEYIIGSSVDVDDSEEDIEKISKAIKRPVQVVTQSMEEGKTFENYGTEYKGEKIFLFRNEQGTYQPIENPKSDDTPMKRVSEIEKPKRKPFGNKFKVKVDGDFKIVWDISKTSDMLSGRIIASLKSKIIVVDNREKRIEEYIAFYKANQRQPSHHTKDSHERRIGQWRCTMKRTAKGFGFSVKLTDEQVEYVESVDPDFFKEQDFEAAKMQWINDYCSFYIENKRQPRPRSGLTDFERKLGQWRDQVKTSSKSIHSKRLPLTKTQRTILEDVDPDFFKDFDKSKNQRIEEYISFYRANQRQPKDNSSDKDEKRAAKWRSHMRYAECKGQTPLNVEQRAKVLDVDPLFFQYQDFDGAKNQKLEEYIAFYKENQRQPKESSSDNDEKLAAHWRSNMKRAAKLGSTLSLTKEQQTKVLNVDPDFFQDLAGVKNQKIKEYISFYRANQRQPKDSSTDESEKQIAKWRSRMKLAAKSKRDITPLNEEQITTVLSVDPFFFQYQDIDGAKNQRLEEYIAFYVENHRQPKENKSDKDENRVAQWRGDMKKAYKEIGKAIPLTEDQQTTVLAIDPDFFQDKDLAGAKNQRIDEYIAFYKANQRQPKENQSDKVENLAAQWRGRMKRAANGVKRITPLTKEQQTIVLSVDPDFFQKGRTKKSPCITPITPSTETCDSCGTEIEEDTICSCKILTQSRPGSPKLKKSKKAVNKPVEKLQIFEIYDTCESGNDIEEGSECSSCTKPKPLSVHKQVVENESSCSKEPTHKAPPPIKTLDECLAIASALTPEEKNVKIGKVIFQGQNGYRPEAKQANPDKLEANRLFASQAKNNIGDALILDSSNFITTMALVSVGYDKERIYIPQYDKDEYDLQKQEHNHVSNESLNECLSGSDDTKYTAAWFDYTCTFNGNVNCRPEEDIKLYFSRKFPDKESVFAVTFCKREKTEDAVDRVENTKKRISRIAKENGYALTVETKYEYGNMYFIMWEVLEIK